jgi:hypothetical protein
VPHPRSADQAHRQEEGSQRDQPERHPQHGRLAPSADGSDGVPGGYLQAKGSASPREALLDLDINSGSFTRRITELRDAGFPIAVEAKRHPVSRRRYNVYTYAVA